MSIIAFIGDCTTTTCLALASAWPGGDDVVIVEADRSGGSLAAWLDTPTTPSLSSIVATARSFDNADRASVLESMTHRSASGIRFVAAPTRSREANRAIVEANRSVFPMLSTIEGTVMLADLGARSAVDGPPPFAALADTLVICHRQDTSSAGAAAVRLERLAELVDELAPLGAPLVLIVIGDRPFDSDEIQRFVAADGRMAITTHQLPVDVLAAAVFAGRTGVSQRRLGRLPLVRDARRVAVALRPQSSPTADDTAIDDTARNATDIAVTATADRMNLPHVAEPEQHAVSETTA
jgi:MinD-like ATPase involved in chromosome partitioning or flagellar assembly